MSQSDRTHDDSLVPGHTHSIPGDRPSLPMRAQGGCIALEPNAVRSVMSFHVRQWVSGGRSDRTRSTAF